MSTESGTLQSLEAEIEDMPDATDTLMSEIDELEKESGMMKPDGTLPPIAGAAAKYSIPGSPGAAGTGAAGESAVDGEPPAEGEEAPVEKKVYAEYSYFCIHRDKWIRTATAPILEHPRFDQLSLTIIGLNCLTLAMFDPLDPKCARDKCIVISGFEFAWTIFFTVEFFFKWLVMGFSGKGGYWQDPWNRLDFVIVCFGAIDFLPGGVEIPGASALRTLRAIRPLRALNKFPSLRILVNLLCETLPQMASVGILCFFIFFVFGILAVQIWNGLFHQRCFGALNTTSAGSFFGDAYDEVHICTMTEDQQSGMNECPPDACGNSGFSRCAREGPNPSWGAIHFDHIFAAWVAIFQCITLEAWVDIMYLVQDAYGFWSWLYFVGLIIVGSWFAVNLTLVVISAQFGSTKSDQLDQMNAQVQKEREERAAREKKERRMKKIHWITKLRLKYCGYVLPETALDRARQERVEKIEGLEVELAATNSKDQAAIERLNAEIEKQDDALKAVDTFTGDDDEAAASGVFTLIDDNENEELDVDEFKKHFKEKFFVQEQQAEALFKHMDANNDGRLTREEFVVGYVDFKDSQRNCCIRSRVKLRRIVMSDDFSNAIMSCIAFNVVFMAIEFHGQPDELTMVVDGANIVFCMIFAGEMVAKLIAIGLFEYISDGFNVFDGTIVIISLIELGGGGGGLSVLRTFRLVRVFRLISFLPTLQKQIAVMIQTIGEVGSFLLILALFIFIIAVVGMFIYGGQFTWDENTGNQCDVQTDFADNNFVWKEGCITDRKNFDTFGWAMITVFQVLTCEDWNAAMYNGVRAWDHLSGSIYFIFLIVFGNYILFNLFVAILIDGFAAPPEEDAEEEEVDKDGNPIANVEVANPALEEQPVVQELAENDTKPADGSGTGTGTGTGTVEGSGVGCGGMQMSVNPLSQHTITVKRRNPAPKLRLIDHLMPGMVGPNSQVMARRGIWKWGTGCGEPEAKHTRATDGDTWRGPWRRDDTLGGSSSSPGSGVGSGVGETAEKTDLIQADNAEVIDTDVKENLPNGDGEKKSDPEPQPVAEEVCNSGDVPVGPQSCFSRDRSLGLFNTDSSWRMFCAELVDDTTPRGIILDRFIMGTIMANSVTLAMERPAIEKGSAERVFLDIAGNLFGFIFLVEFIMKISAWNFMYGPTTVTEKTGSRKFKGPARYWDEGWNKLDGSLVIISVIDVILSNIPGLGGGAILSLLKIFRILRALRPLRAVNKLPGLKLVVNCLLASLGPIGTTLIIVATIFFIFGILGTQLFKGTMWFCNGKDGIPSTASDIRPVTNKVDCEYYDGYWDGSQNITTTWTRQYYNFDNLLQSLLTLFVLCSIDGWVDIMYQGIDAVGPDEEPEEGANDIMSLYFIAFLLIGGFLILNMFVGVILENFNQAQEAEEERKKAAIAAGLEPPEPEKKDAAPDPLDGDYYLTHGPFRMACYKIVRSDTFDSAIAAIIMANVTIMAMEHYEPAEWFIQFLKVQNYFFSITFFFEFLIKLTTYGTLYFGDNWCRFDFFLVLVSIFDVVMEVTDATLPVNPTILRVARVMRIARILRLMKGQWAEDLRKLLVTVSNSLAQAGNLGLLLFLLYFICACLGIELFGRLACTETNPCEGMSNKANFENFFMALLTLFRLSTGDNWNGILKDALRKAPTVNADTCSYSPDCIGGCDGVNVECCAGCDPDELCEENCCASSIMSPMFFTFFILAAQFVMLNLVVAVLMKELGDAEKADAAEQAALDANNAALEAGADGADNVEVLGGDRRSRRKSFDEMMSDGKNYWKRRFSNAVTPNNVMYNFPDKNANGSGGNATEENVETVEVNDEEAALPRQTGQTDTTPGTPDRIEGGAVGEQPERPPTRSAWGGEEQ